MPSPLVVEAIQLHERAEREFRSVTSRCDDTLEKQVQIIEMAVGSREEDP
ncbi:MAG: hypothetical protein V4550_17375 [Gemmatimonadota bacterium]